MVKDIYLSVCHCETLTFVIKVFFYVIFSIAVLSFVFSSVILYVKYVFVQHFCLHAMYTEPLHRLPVACKHFEESEGESRVCPLATANKSNKQLLAFCLNFLELELSFTFIGTESSR